MSQEQDKLGHDLTLAEILDLLEQASWTHVGEIKNLVHPNDTPRLAKLVEACDRRLDEINDGPRRENLRLARKRLHATASLNQVLPMPAFEKGVMYKEITRPERTFEAASSPFPPRKRRRTRRQTTSPALPGFESYHHKIMEWLDQNKFSQNSLAEFLMVDPSYLSRAVRGERQNRDLFLKIENLTGISAPFLREPLAPAPEDHHESDDDQEVN